MYCGDDVKQAQADSRVKAGWKRHGAEAASRATRPQGRSGEVRAARSTNPQLDSLSQLGGDKGSPLGVLMGWGGGHVCQG